MATVTGNEYDHITISDGTNNTVHYLKDTAARADITDLKSAVIATTGNEIIKFTEKFGYNTGENATLARQVDNDTNSVVYPCSPGDVFTISGEGWSSFALWAFYGALDGGTNKYPRLSYSGANAKANLVEITAPANTTRLVVNVKRSPSQYVGLLCRGVILHNRLEKITSDIENMADDIEDSAEIISELTESFPTEAYERSAYNPGWEQGGLSSSTGEETESSGRIRTGFIPIDEEILGSFQSDANQDYWVRIYNNSKEFIGNGVVNSGGNIIRTVPSAEAVSYNYDLTVDSAKNVQNAKYIRLVVKFVTSEEITPSDCKFDMTIIRGAFVGVSLDTIYARKAKETYSSSEIVFAYEIGSGYNTKGFLKLPPNYTSSGEKVPLVVFVHGSADVGSYSSESMTTHYQTYYNYIRDNGYAIFDCYGLGSKYPTGSYANTWGIPLNDDCYLSGIHYVCEKYNIDENNIFVCCKSLGGLQAFNMLLNPAYNIKAVGMFAPELWELSMTFGYQAKERKLIAENLGFSEDTGDVLDFDQGDPIPSGFYDYITANMDKWNGIFPNFRGLPILPVDKPTYYNSSISLTGNMFRASRSVPLQIWIAQDDSAVSYTVADAVVKSLQNAGSNAILRTMPNNTGGHHAVDNDANALKTTDVTTRLNIHYDSIPTAYYEFVQFIERFRSN